MFKKKDDSYAMVNDSQLLEGGSKATGLNDSGDESHDLDAADEKFGAKSQQELQQSTVIDGFAEFDRYGPLFQDLTKRHCVDTDGCEVVGMAISYDSKAALAIVAKGDEHFEL